MLISSRSAAVRFAIVPRGPVIPAGGEAIAHYNRHHNLGFGLERSPVDD